jgi:Tol biopolymer transport system component
MRNANVVIAAACLCAMLAAGVWAAPATTSAPASASDKKPADPVAALAAEVRDAGAIAYCAKTAKGDWDIFLARPDGSGIRNITATPDASEFLPRFSPDGKRLMYRRGAAKITLDNNRHGTQGALWMADADGGHAAAFGADGEFPWASWSPDGTQIASLGPDGVAIVDVRTKKLVRKIARGGFFQQMTWSPDGKWLLGVSNGFDAAWGVGRLEIDTGKAGRIMSPDCCTPDWLPDCRDVIHSNRPSGQQGYGWTQLWLSSADGRTHRLVYGEDGRHIYGGCASPDGRYVLFTGNDSEDGDPSHEGSAMGLMRLADAPTIGGASPALRKLHGKTKDGPVLTLPKAFEPHWTSARLLDAASQPAERK